jgi:hypothetical protein
VLDQYQKVYDWDDLHGPWLYQLPDDFVNQLAVQNGTAITTLAEQWNQLGFAFRTNNAPLGWVEQTLLGLVKLAQRAKLLNKKMYWQVPSC